MITVIRGLLKRSLSSVSDLRPLLGIYMCDIYRDAASVLEKLEKREAGLKTLCFGSDIRNKKAVYALVCETLKYMSALKQIVNDIPELCKSLASDNKKSDVTMMVFVMLYELLLGKKSIKGGGSIKRSLLEHKEAIEKKFEKLRRKNNAQSDTQLLIPNRLRTTQLPRYARINTLKMDKKKVCKILESEGWTFSSSDLTSPSDTSSKSISHDPHVKDLLIFPAGTDLHDHALVSNGSLILQDKSSCFSAQILDPVRGAHVLDACAAPGNKTAHLAAIIQNKGKIFAFEISPNRASLLKRRLKQAGVQICDVNNSDFLKCDPLDKKYTNVQYILCDPSCSGSGMVLTRLDHALDDPSSDQSGDRLKSLADFQVNVVRHAMRFPSVKRIVYSTCSVHAQENEDVVARILQSPEASGDLEGESESTGGAGDGVFQLSPVLPSWPRRGLPILNFPLTKPSAVCVWTLTPI